MKSKSGIIFKAEVVKQTQRNARMCGTSTIRSWEKIGTPENNALLATSRDTI